MNALCLFQSLSNMLTFHIRTLDCHLSQLIHLCKSIFRYVLVTDLLPFVSQLFCTVLRLYALVSLVRKACRILCSVATPRQLYLYISGTVRDIDYKQTPSGSLSYRKVSCLNFRIMSRGIFYLYGYSKMGPLLDASCVKPFTH